MFFIGSAPIICDARSTVNGFVMAPANPKPQANMEQINPVKESYPAKMHSDATIGSIVSISSNSPRKEPKQ